MLTHDVLEKCEWGIGNDERSLRSIGKKIRVCVTHLRRDHRSIDGVVQTWVCIHDDEGGGHQNDGTPNQTRPK